ncbi:transcriptional regulator [Erwinia sp. E602]|uniref:winged helix-turn-helix domain-containing protein n=1 Tax=unclassified Erwinia TaxID=2622719 RepID=UPI000C774566|nr:MULTISPECIES: transcriptional regulator [unclassified Erwinia]PLV60837.1 hypothetical protein NV64_11645 [Erwinia sp. B116]QUG74312.1 transcriptional regulator [Erwinia sp. E602]
MNTDFIIHHWLVDSASGSLIHQQTGEQRRLGEFQFKLLQVLIEHVGQPLSRDELTSLVWERRVIGNNSLPNAIHALRVALDDNGKEQRIIRTLPRKGYILDADFCHSGPSAETVAPSTSTRADELPVNEELPVDEEPAPSEAGPPAILPEPVSTPPRPSRFWRRLVACQCMVLLVVAGWLFGRQIATEGSEMTEVSAGVYSNIRLVELYRGWEVFSAAEDLSSQLGPVLFTLNQQLASSKMTMDVYFYAYGSSLNYTLSLKNACGAKQLAMNISNWRTDEVQLNTLISRETQRKINEMANCAR